LGWPIAPDLCSILVDRIVHALAEQQAELADLLDGLAEPGWHAPTRCEGWDVSDVVLHLTQSDEMAIASATGRFPEAVAEQTDGWVGPSSVDRAAALMVDRERGMPIADLLERWTSNAGQLIEVLNDMNLSTRVRWVAGDLSARTLATTRLSETWIHAGDVAGSFGSVLVPTDRLRLVARLAWRTLPYAFASAGLSMNGPVAFCLISPSGEAWDFLPDEPAVTTITGLVVDLCAVAARRIDPSATSLRGQGPDTSAILALVRTYA
jgi:uncharacterized protein (TIGR03084 family)